MKEHPQGFQVVGGSGEVRPSPSSGGEWCGGLGGGTRTPPPPASPKPRPQCPRCMGQRRILTPTPDGEALAFIECDWCWGTGTDWTPRPPVAVTPRGVAGNY